MSKKRLSGEELYEEFKRREAKNKEENEKKLREARKNVPKCCRNCRWSWYRYVLPTGSFLEPSEFCGCRLKVSLVDPNGVCENFL
ncbi:MAG: hypothetical protein ACI4VO_03090 [Clostridia bacterium]